MRRKRRGRTAAQARRRGLAKKKGAASNGLSPELTQGLKEQKDNEERLRRSSFAKKHSATMLGRLKRWLLAMLTLPRTQSSPTGKFQSFRRECGTGLRAAPVPPQERRF